MGLGKFLCVCISGSCSGVSHPSRQKQLDFTEWCISEQRRFEMTDKGLFLHLVFYFSPFLPRYLRIVFSLRFSLLLLHQLPTLSTCQATSVLPFLSVSSFCTSYFCYSTLYLQCSSRIFLPFSLSPRWPVTHTFEWVVSRNTVNTSRPYCAGIHGVLRQLLYTAVWLQRSHEAFMKQ
jgi:hypothetical protein